MLVQLQINQQRSFELIHILDGRCMATHWWIRFHQLFQWVCMLWNIIPHSTINSNIHISVWSIEWMRLFNYILSHQVRILEIHNLWKNKQTYSDFFHFNIFSANCTIICSAYYSCRWVCFIINSYSFISFCKHIYCLKHTHIQMTIYCPTQDYVCSVITTGESWTFRDGQMYCKTTDNCVVEWYVLLL